MSDDFKVSPRSTIYGMDPMLALKLLWEVIKLVLGNDLINRALDNFFKKTANKIDDMVWALLEKAMSISHDKRKEYVMNGLVEIQTIYDIAKNEGGIIELKQPLMVWDNSVESTG